AQTLPLGGRAIGEGMAPEGEPMAPGEDAVVFLNTVSPGYFDVLGIPLVSGRDFTTEDRPGSPRVAIVNETLARRFWSGASPLGRRLRVGGRAEDAYEVVGVARDGKYVSQTETPRPFAYFPILQQGNRYGETILLVRGAEGADRVAAGVREAVRGIDPTLPLF